MNKRIKKKKMKYCDYCSIKAKTTEVYNDLNFCKKCKEQNDSIAAISESIEG